MHYRAYAGGNVVKEGSVTGKKAQFQADEKVTHVVFYEGTKSAEVVAGCAELPTPKSGKVSVTFES